MTPRSRAQWAAFAAGLFVVELLIATVGRHVPIVRADLGDYLVVILLYAMAKAVRPFRALPLAVVVFAIGLAVEAAQFFAVADRLGLTRGSAGSIVIGNTASLSDLAMYFAGCATAWLLDVEGRKKRGAQA